MRQFLPILTYLLTTPVNSSVKTVLIRFPMKLQFTVNQLVNSLRVLLLLLLLSISALRCPFLPNLSKHKAFQLISGIALVPLPSAILPMPGAI